MTSDKEAILPKTVLCTHEMSAPKALQGLKIAFISDVHMASYRKPDTLKPLFKQIAALHADLILWGGDYAESAEYQRAFFKMAAQLRPRLGMFGVMGNNDRECFGSAFPLMRGIASRAGIRLLINEETCIEENGANIRIAGLDEWKYGLPNAKGMFKKSAPGDLRILLSHYPHAADTFFDQAANPAHLVLCGHTHGGQIRFLGRSCYDLGYGYQYARRSERFAVSGWRELNEQNPDGTPFVSRMLVSNGAGESLLPIRIFCPRQIHLITLQ